jgi:hypothetical protein
VRAGWNSDGGRDLPLIITRREFISLFCPVSSAWRLASRRKIWPNALVVVLSSSSEAATLAAPVFCNFIDDVDQMVGHLLESAMSLSAPDHEPGVASCAPVKLVNHRVSACAERPGGILGGSRTKHLVIGPAYPGRARPKGRAKPSI